MSWNAGLQCTKYDNIQLTWRLCWSSSHAARGREQPAFSCYWLDLLFPISSHIQLTHCALLFLLCPFCLPQTHAERIKTVLDDLRCSSPPHHFSAADMPHLCCSFQKDVLLTAAGGRALGWQFWAASQRCVSHWLSIAGLGWGTSLAGSRGEWSGAGTVTTDVGSFAGTELQVTALTFSSPHFPRNNKFSCSHIGTIFRS